MNDAARALSRDQFATPPPIFLLTTVPHPSTLFLLLLLWRISQVQSGLAYKSKKTTKKVSIRIAPTADGSVKGEVSEASWMRVARGWQLRLSLKAGGSALFDGFKNSEKVQFEFAIFLSTVSSLRLV